MSVRDAVDVNFESRWTAWKARGLAHDLVVRQRFVTAAAAAAILAFGAVIAYALLVT